MSTGRVIVGWLAVLVLSVFAVPGQAQAGEFGFSVGQDLGVVNVAGLESLTSTGTRIGYRSGQLHLFGTLDYASLGGETETIVPNGENSSADGNYSLTTVGLGTRYMFAAPQKAEQEVIPYTVGSVYTVIPGGDFDDEVNGFNYDSYWDLGFLAGFGADYYFTDSFSIGGEFGLKGLFGGVTSEVNNSDLERTTNLNSFQLYSGVNFSFYL
jgi:hypothetical protein